LGFFDGMLVSFDLLFPFPVKLLAECLCVMISHGYGAVCVVVQMLQEHNPVCADCAAVNPDWASLNLGVLVSLCCSTGTCLC
jgi:hypothetical protein